MFPINFLFHATAMFLWMNEWRWGGGKNCHAVYGIHCQTFGASRTNTRCFANCLLIFVLWYSEYFCVFKLISKKLRLVQCKHLFTCISGKQQVRKYEDFNLNFKLLLHHILVWHYFEWWNEWNGKFHSKMWNLPHFCKSSNINSLRTLKFGILSQFIDNFALQTTKGEINASLKTKSLP